MPPWLAHGAALGFGAAASPGPFQAFLLSRGARDGPVRALPLALAPLASDGPVIALILLALSQAPPLLLRGLGVAGGAFLLWIAWGTARSLAAAGGDPRPAAPGAAALPAAAEDGARAAEGPGGSFARAALVNALGPGPWIFWSAVGGPTLLEAWRAGPGHALAFLGGFYALLIGGNGALVVLAGWAGGAGPRAARALGWASAVVMAALGALQLWRGITGS
jgi:threonine/homoserine/homoserine lactone efflux protein